MDTLLYVENLHVSFEGFLALHNLNLILEPQERIRLLIGPNGAGKTTLFDALTGQVEPVMGGRLVALARGHRHRRRPAPAGELGLGGEAGRVADLDQQVHRADRGDPVFLGERAAQPAE